MANSFTKLSLAQQLAGKLEQLIRSGHWPSGMQLPAIRRIAADYDVSINTAHLALRELEAAGQIQRHQHGAAFVQSGLVEDGPAHGDDRSQRAHIAMIGGAGPGLIPDRDAWGVRILMAAEAELFKNSEFHLARVGSVQPDQRLYIQELVSQLERLGPNLAGAIIFGANNDAYYQALRTVLERLDVPWVSINRPTERISHNFVSADNLGVGQTVGRCFTLLDFKRVLLVSPDLRQGWAWRQKMMGLIDAYLLAGTPIHGIEYLRSAGTRQVNGYDAMQAYLRKAHEPPEAVFALSDLLAMGALRACQDAGLDVPGQVSVVGATGLAAGRLTTPPLTVMTQPMVAMGRMAVRRLLEMIRTGQRRIPGYRIAGRLIVRESLRMPSHVRQTLVAEGLLRLRTQRQKRRPAARMIK